MKSSLALLTLTLLLTGCSASKGRVTARADEGHTLLAQSFSNAYAKFNVSRRHQSDLWRRWKLRRAVSE